jgi:hypothetical protein
MRNRLLAVVVAASLLAAACGAASSPSSSAAAPEPVADATRDATFALALSADRARYRAGEPISALATFTYLGPKAAERVFHAASAIGFRIEEIGGTRGMAGGMNMPCLFTDVTAAQPVPVPFAKAGVPGGEFDMAWYQDPVLTLPTGSWRIIAYLDVYLGDCGGERHALEVGVGVAVEP